MTLLRIRSAFSLSFLLIASSVFRLTLALQVTPGSPCAALCMDQEDGNAFSADSSSTNATDIVCQDSLYSNSAEGAKFKRCLECLQKSDKTNRGEADNYWLLYNLRHALGTCLYGFGDEEKVINSPCVISWACEPLEDAILSGGLDPDDSDQFGYCSAGNGSLFGKTLNACVKCLKASDDESYLGNFMVVLQVGCAQEPEPGVTLGISGSPFSRANLEVTIGSDDDENADPGASPSTLTTGAIVGIAVGGALLVFGGIALYVIHRRKKKGRNGASLSSMGQDPAAGPDPNLPGGRSSTPMSGPGKPWMGHGYSHSHGSAAGAGGESRSAASSRASGHDDAPQGGGRQITNNGHVRNYSRGGHERSISGHLSSMPAHPAYNPHQASSRSNTPTPPPSTFQRHRGGPSENLSSSSSSSFISSTSSHRPSPPRGPSPAAAAVRDPAQTTGAARAAGQDGFVLAPAPPRTARVPDVVAPSPPRVRAPKKYTPPTIIVDMPADTRSPRFIRVGA